MKYQKQLLGLMIGFFLIQSIVLASTKNDITGHVKNVQTGQPLPGANIFIEGTTIGTISNQDGYFELKQIPVGQYRLIIRYIGYLTATKKIHLTIGDPMKIEILLTATVLDGKDVLITAKADANRAIFRESPIAFTTLSQQQLRAKHTTGDLPDLLKEIPGVWSTSAGLGEAEIMVRGFSTDKVRFLVNNVPMNEPEDQMVYWSNWTGLGSTAQTVQVQRGAGFSLYGTGAFGGSVFIETMGVSSKKETVVRFSIGRFKTEGVESGPLQGKISNGMGTFDPTYNPVNYTYSVRHQTGDLYNGKLNLSFYLEWKTGDSYIHGTTYDGYAFGLEAQSVFENHKLRMSFIGSPQTHNQAFAFQDFDLLNTLGREYNRTNHEWQENYYFKPLWSLKHEWTISPKQNLISTAFYTFGRGADQSHVNGFFDVETGEYGYLPVSIHNDNVAFGQHAEYLYYNFGVVTTDFKPWGGPDDPPTFRNTAFRTNPLNIYTEQYDHSWQNRKRRDHHQFGLISYFNQKINHAAEFVVGAESRFWFGNRKSEVRLFRCSELIANGRLATIDKLQPVYDYDTDIKNVSIFGRTTLKPTPLLTIQGGGQLAYTRMEVIENPIRLLDLGSGEYFDRALRTSADQLVDIEIIETAFGSDFKITGTPRFQPEDYIRAFPFATFWAGSNYNITHTINSFANFALSKKEPALLDWYDFDRGPQVEPEINPETALNFELGVGYQSPDLKINTNYYHTIYKDKIESVIDINDRRTTINAGQALFQGIELEFSARIGAFDLGGSTSFARNRWKKLYGLKVFDVDREDVVDKVVPFSPERTLFFSIDHNYKTYRYGLKVNWWDEYYGTYTNFYEKSDGTTASSKLPYFLDLSARFSYDFQINNLLFTFRLDLNNILSRKDNFLRGQYTVDYVRTDDLAGKYHWYVLQAPLFNAFFTTELHIQ